jgi:hypothetical protein
MVARIRLAKLTGGIVFRMAGVTPASHVILKKKFETCNFDSCNFETCASSLK